MIPCSKWFAAACLISQICAGALASEIHDPLVREWISQCKAMNGIEVRWLEVQDVLTRGGEIGFSFDVRHDVEVRWPNAAEVRSRVVPTGNQRESALAIRFDRDFLITGSGVVSESFIKRAESNTSMVGSSKRLGLTQVSLVPSLLGIWLEESPPETVFFDRVSAESFRVRFNELGMRATVQRRPAEAGQPMLVVTRLESVLSGDSPGQWWDFDDFVALEGGGAIGRTRTWHSILADGRVYDSMPAEVQGVRRLGMGAPVSFEERSETSKDRYEEHWQAMRPSRPLHRSLASAGPALAWIGVGGLLLTGAVVMYRRVR